MHRFYLPAEECVHDQLVLRGSEAHHAAKVLRLRPGESVSVLDGAGSELQCRIDLVQARAVTLQVEGRARQERLPWQITLFQGLPKNKAFETIIQKATELGVARIIPLLTERSTVQIEPERSEEKQQKWQLIAIEALKQSGLSWLPVISSATTLSNYLRNSERFDVNLVGSLQPDSRHPKDFLTTVKGVQTVALWIGPEGDFSAAELEAIREAGAASITLGPHVLRCDTAAIYCLAMVNYELSAGREARSRV